MASATSAGQTRVTQTQRKDWDSLVDELYAQVISGAPFGIGVVTKHKGLLGTSIKSRLNQKFPNPQMPSFIRKQFQVAQLDRIFDSEAGLERDAGGFYKVVGDNLGLPRNTLLALFGNPADKNLRGVMLFGGERMAGQLERRLQTATSILDGTGSSSPHGGIALESREDLMAALAKLSPKRLYEYDMDMMARIVNGLEETKEDLPKALKPIFRSVSEYILTRRLKRRP
jgi:hypothetical protein